MSWPWKYGHRQPIPPDDLPDDFSEEQVPDTGEDDDECRLQNFLGRSCRRQSI